MVKASPRYRPWLSHPLAWSCWLLGSINDDENMDSFTEFIKVFFIMKIIDRNQIGWCILVAVDRWPILSICEYFHKIQLSCLLLDYNQYHLRDSIFAISWGWKGIDSVDVVRCCSVGIHLGKKIVLRLYYLVWYMNYIGPMYITYILFPNFINPLPSFKLTHDECLDS